MLVIKIIQGKEKSLLSRQPWIYASAVERVDGHPREKMQSGATALILSSSGQFLARAAHSPKSQIRARVWSFDQDEAIDHALIKRRVKAAVTGRVRSASPRLAANKSDRWHMTPLILGEEDGLPGLLVDWYAGQPGYLVCQFQAAGVDAWKIPIVQSLIAETGCPNVYERADELIRKGEGLPLSFGALAGDAPPDELLVSDKGQAYSANIKTGARNNRR